MEEVARGDSSARFTITAVPEAELPAQRIGAAIWRRLGWVNPDPASAERPAATSGFGPVIERVLNDPDDRPCDETLVLSTGALSSELAGAEKMQGGRIRRLVASPGDLYAEYDDYVGGRWALITAGLALADLLPGQWDSVTVSDLHKALEHLP